MFQTTNQIQYRHMDRFSHGSNWWVVVFRTVLNLWTTETPETPETPEKHENILTMRVFQKPQKPVSPLKYSQKPQIPQFDWAILWDFGNILDS